MTMMDEIQAEPLRPGIHVLLEIAQLQVLVQRHEVMEQLLTRLLVTEMMEIVMLMMDEMLVEQQNQVGLEHQETVQLQVHEQKFEVMEQ